ncbi:MAG: peptide chain release factor N(5)-glutamine methyltransferase [Aquificae bacterium]|nr:peptide chain release factor N(5)-glutamine methyltransferase [Aquificota bacterium]
MKLRQLLFSLPQEIRRDGEIILSHLLKTKPSNLPLLLESEVSPDLLHKFRTLIEKRRRGYPTAYLIGEWDFYGRTFKVQPGVLVPRPETELLVEKTLELIPDHKPHHGYEIGSGTGVISITLLLERPLLKMSAVDIDPQAVRLTQENAQLHGVSSRLEVLEGNLFQPVEGRRFDFIISNPPYIPLREWENLPPEVKKEKKTALIGGEKGYEFYERIAPLLKNYLKEGGFVALEIGHDQGDIVRKLLTREAGLEKVIIYKDYSGQDRVAIGWNL